MAIQPGASVSIPLATKSDPARTDLVTGERLVNMFVEPAPHAFGASSKTSARAPYAIYRTPGLKNYARVSTNLNRGLFAAEDLDQLLTLCGQRLYAINSERVITPLTGSIAGVDDAVICRNMQQPNPQIVWVVDNGVYILKETTVTKVSDNDLIDDINSADFIDTYVIYGADDGTMQSSDINDASSVDALNFATASANPDGLIRVKTFRDELYAFGKESIEPWTFDASNTAFPLSPIKGAVIPVGLLGKHAVCDLGGQLYWVDQLLQVQRLGQGYSPQRISRVGVERDLQEYMRNGGDKRSVIMWGYADRGHQFIHVRSPEFCWVYDASTGEWAEKNSNQHPTWQAKYYARCFDTHVVSVDQSGFLGELDPETYDEFDIPLIVEAILPPLDAYPGGGVVDQLMLDIETGTAGDASAAPEDQNPTISMSVSIDGGKTWSHERSRSLGVRGQWKKTVDWTRLGKFGRQGMMIKLTYSARIAAAILRASIRVRPRAQ